MLLSAGLLAGALVTGLIVATAGGLLSPVPAEVRLPIFACAVVAAVVVQIARPRWRLPDIRRQVPDVVFGLGELRSAGIFGLELGLGWRTQLTTLAPQTLALGCVLLALPWPTVAILCCGFAAGRFVHVIARLMSGDGEKWDVRLSARPGLMSAASVGSLVVFAEIAGMVQLFRP